MDALTGALIAIFSVGGAAAITALFKGLQGWKSGAARTEARAIQNLEKYRDEADWRADVAEHRGSYKDELIAYWQSRAGNAEFKIRTKWGEENLPPVDPLPVYVPLTKADQKALPHG